MELYIMRHGETNWNHNGIIQGRSKNRLSKLGESQVKAQAEKFKDTPFDLIISSPLVRTIQTSKIMNQYHGVKILKDDRLIEIDQGVFVGRKKKTLTSEEKEIREKRLPEYGIESYESVVKRTKDFLIDLKSKYSDKTILVCTHRSIASSLFVLVKNMDATADEVRDFDMFGNAEVQHCHID